MGRPSDNAASDSALGLLGIDAESTTPRGPEASQTDWSMVFRAARSSRPGASDALDQIARRYWPAIFAFVRSSGRDIHEAADVTQGFVCDVVLMRNLLASADPRRGRFRTFLLSALKNYMHDQHRRASRLKRSHQGAAPLQLDQVELARTAVDEGDSPDRVFSSQWGATMLSQVLDRVRAECEADGLDVHWNLFEQRVIAPSLFGQPPASYQDLVSRFHLKSRSQAANMVITVKRRVVRAMVLEVGRTVEDPDQVQEELRDLLSDLEPPA